jgi:hypothetical protein
MKMRAICWRDILRAPKKESLLLLKAKMLLFGWKIGLLCNQQQTR